LQQITSTILWRLNNKSAKVRQQAADLISRIAVVMKTCGEDKLMGHLGVVLYEYLGEEYPEVLGSILGGLKSIVNVIGMSSMTPPIKDLLPRLTPILKNRYVFDSYIVLLGLPSLTLLLLMSIQARKGRGTMYRFGWPYC